MASKPTDSGGRTRSETKARGQSGDTGSGAGTNTGHGSQGASGQSDSTSAQTAVKDVNKNVGATPSLTNSGSSDTGGSTGTNTEHGNEGASGQSAQTTVKGVNKNVGATPVTSSGSGASVHGSRKSAVEASRGAGVQTVQPSPQQNRPDNDPKAGTSDSTLTAEGGSNESGVQTEPMEGWEVVGKSEPDETSSKSSDERDQASLKRQTTSLKFFPHGCEREAYELSSTIEFYCWCHLLQQEKNSSQLKHLTNAEFQLQDNGDVWIRSTISLKSSKKVNEWIDCVITHVCEEAKDTKMETVDLGDLDPVAVKEQVNEVDLVRDHAVTVVYPRSKSDNTIAVLGRKYPLVEKTVEAVMNIMSTLKKEMSFVIQLQKKILVNRQRFEILFHFDEWTQVEMTREGDNKLILEGPRWLVQNCAERMKEIRDELVERWEEFSEDDITKLPEESDILKSLSDIPCVLIFEGKYMVFFALSKSNIAKASERVQALLKNASGVSQESAATDQSELKDVPKQFVVTENQLRVDEKNVDASEPAGGGAVMKTNDLARHDRNPKLSRGNKKGVSETRETSRCFERLPVPLEDFTYLERYGLVFLEDIGCKFNTIIYLADKNGKHEVVISGSQKNCGESMCELRKLLADISTLPVHVPSHKLLSLPLENTEQETKCVFRLQQLKSNNWMAKMTESGFEIQMIPGSINANDVDLIAVGIVENAGLMRGQGDKRETSSACPDVLKQGRLERIYDDVCCRLKPGEKEVVFCDPGCLPCKRVAYMLMPESSNGTRKEKTRTEKVVTEMLEKASGEGISTVAVQLRSDLKLNLGTKPILKAVREFLERNPQSSVSLVQLFLSDLRKTDMITVLKDAAMSKQSIQLGWPCKFAVKGGDILKQQVDILVNSVGCELDLKKGHVSSLILQQAGKKLQDDCHRQCPGGIRCGDIVCTESFALKTCSQIFHITLLDWSKNSADKIKEELRKIVRKCLEKASELERQSIAFPTLGCGNLGYPPEVSARVMIGAVKEFFLNTPSSLEKVFIIPFAGDDKIVKVFEGEFENAMMNRPSTGMQNVKFGTEHVFVSSDEKVTWKVVHGNGLEFMKFVKFDGIVCLWNHADFEDPAKFPLPLREAGEQEIQWQSHVHDMKTKGQAKTSAGNLPSSLLTHGYSHSQDLTRATAKALSNVDCLTETLLIPAMDADPKALAKGLMGFLEEREKRIDTDGRLEKKITIVFPSESQVHGFCKEMKAASGNFLTTLYRYMFSETDKAAAAKEVDHRNAGKRIHTTVTGLKDSASKVVEMLKRSVKRSSSENLGTSVDPDLGKATDHGARVGRDDQALKEHVGTVCMNLPVKSEIGERTQELLKDLTKCDDIGLLEQMSFHCPHGGKHNEALSCLNLLQQVVMICEGTLDPHTATTAPHQPARGAHQHTARASEPLSTEMDYILFCAAKKVIPLCMQDVMKLSESVGGKIKVALPADRDVLSETDCLQRNDIEVKQKETQTQKAYTVDKEFEKEERVFVRYLPEKKVIVVIGDNYTKVQSVSHKVRIYIGQLSTTTRGRRKTAPQSADDHNPGDAQGEAAMNATSLQDTAGNDRITLPGGLVIFPHKADITKLKVDAIVNAANENLAHGGGVARAIRDAAGPGFQKESYDYVDMNGPIPVSEVGVTSSGNLPCNMVIHAVGPQWNPSKAKLCEKQLFDTVINCLREATKLASVCIAMPAISSGIFGMPLDDCARIYAEAFVEFDRTNATSSVKMVHFVDIKDDMLDKLRNELKKQMASRRDSESSGSIDVKPHGAAASGACSSHDILHSQHGAGQRGQGADVREKQLGSGGHELCSARLEKDEKNPYKFFLQGGRLTETKLVHLCRDDIKRKEYKNKIHWSDTHPSGTECWRSSEIPGVTTVWVKKDVSPQELTSLLTEVLLKAAQKSGTLAIPFYHSVWTSKEMAHSYARSFFDALTRFSEISERGIDMWICDRDEKLIEILKDTFHECISQRKATLIAQTENVTSSSHGNNSVRNPPAAESEECCICLCPFTDPVKLIDCGHVFCKECIEHCFSHQPVCPRCKKVYGIITGDMPLGTMRIEYDRYSHLPGHQADGTIVITYSFPGGIQEECHPSPGKWYSGIARFAYLPDNSEGRKVLKLLQVAFDRKLTFTIGRSVTMGRDNVITWNDIHHKTSTSGSFGYPDPDYLKRVQEELASRGVTEESIKMAQSGRSKDFFQFYTPV